MIRSLLRLALLGIVCLVVYNYFFGKPEEKAQSKRIFQGVGAVFTDVRNMIRSERDKGTFDRALSKTQDVIERLKSHADETNDPNLKRQATALEQRRRNLEQKVDNTEGVPANSAQKVKDKAKQYNDMARELESLTNDLQNLVNKVAPSEN